MGSLTMKIQPKKKNPLQKQKQMGHSFEPFDLLKLILQTKPRVQCSEKTSKNQKQIGHRFKPFSLQWGHRETECLKIILQLPLQ